MLKELFIQAVILSLSAGIIVLLITLLRLVLKKAPRWMVCALWALVAVRLLIPALPQSSVSVVPRAVSEGTIVREAAAQPAEAVVKVPEEAPEYAEIVAREPELPVQQDTQSGVRYVEVSAATHTAPKTFGDTVLPVLAAVWPAGILLMLLYMAGSTLRLRRKMRGASVREQDNIWLCDNISSPFILGMIRPKICLPSALKEPERGCVIAHEQAHLARRDHLWKPLGYLLLSVYWFNPLLWLAYILLCRDIEVACDEKVIRLSDDSYRRQYSEALLFCGARQRLISVCPLAFGEVSVKARIRSVLNYRKPAFWLLAGTLAISLIAAGCSLTNPTGPATSAPETAAPENTVPEATAPSSAVPESSATEVPETQAVKVPEAAGPVPSSENTEQLERHLAFIRTYLQENAPSVYPAEAAEKSVGYRNNSLLHKGYQIDDERITLFSDRDNWEYLYLLALINSDRLGWEQMGYAWYVSSCFTPEDEPALYGHMTPLLLHAAVLRNVRVKYDELAPPTGEDFRMLYDAVARFCFENGFTYGGMYAQDAVIRDRLYNRSTATDWSEGDETLSPYMAASFIAWLDEAYGFKTVSQFCFGQKRFDEAFGTSFSESFASWKAWILETYPFN